MQRGTIAVTRGFPAVGGHAPVHPELVRIIRPDPDLAGWYVVRVDSGGTVVMHESNLTVPA